jgi:chitodextrinase
MSVLGATQLLIPLMVLASTAHAATIPSTSGWFDIPNTHVRSVCPPNNFGGSGYAFSDNCNGLIGAWNGGVFDTARNRFIFWGGGHHDYLGNEIYALDMNTLALSRLTDPAVPVATGCPESLAGGTQPNSRHTYGGIQYMPNVDKMFVFGGALATCGNASQATWLFNFSTNKWEATSPSGPLPNFDYGIVTAYDPNTGKVFVHDSSNLFAYSPDTNSYQQLTHNNNGIDYHMTATLDPKRKKFVILGGGQAWIYDISGSTFTLKALSTTGGSAIANSSYPGLAYSPIRDRIVAWSGGNTVYELNLDTNTWTATSFSGGPSAGDVGVFGHWQYSPALDVFVTVNDVDQDIFTLRLGSSTTVVPFDFSLSVASSESVTAGQSVSFPVTVGLVSGTPQPVLLSALGAPSGTQASFSPMFCTANCASTLTLATSMSTPAGTSTITVTGRANPEGPIHTTSFSFTVNAAGGNITPPSTPTGLTATPFSSSQINLSWTASTSSAGVAGYKIFRNGTQVGTSPTNSFSDTGLTAGTSYSYSVSAFDAQGNDSAQSTSVTATTLASTTGGTLQVGPTRQFKTIGAALAAAADGNTIEIDAGTYNEAVTVSQNNLTLKGIGGYAHLNWGTGNYLTNTTTIPNGKGLIIIDGSGDTIDRLEFSGAKVVDQNGAGIRYEGGDLTIRNSFFHDNENGILGEGGASNTLLIENSIFQKNGYCPSQCAHNVYIGSMGHLIFRFNKSIDSHEGHTLKSRASVNEIISNFLSTKSSDGSYEADFPSGGTLYFIGNVIEQGVNTGNSSILAYGEEGITNSTRVLDVVNNTFYNFLGSGTFLDIQGSPSLIVKNNIFAGGGTIGVTADNTNKTLTASSFANVSQGDYHLVAGSPAIDGGTNPGLDGTFSLTPQFEYVEPASQTSRHVDAVIDSGAYEFSGGGGTTGPVISNVAASGITTSGATITWTTDKPADSQVEYGLSTSYGNQTMRDTTLVTSHSQTISGLSAGTTYNYHVKSQDGAGNLTTSDNFTFTTAAQVVPFDFSFALPGSGSVTAGQSVSFTVTVGLLSGMTQAVSLSVSGAPSGTMVTLSAASCSPDCSSTLTFATSTSTPAGSYPITVTGTFGQLSHTASLTLTVISATVPFDFSLSVPGSGSVTAGQSVSFTVKVGLVSGTTQAVSLSVSGTPSGTMVTLSAASCSPDCSSTLTFATSTSTPAGSYPISVTGTSGPVSHTASLVLTVKERQDDDHDDRAPAQSGYAVITPMGTTTSGTATGLVVFETFGMRGQSDHGALQAGVLASGLTTNAVLFVDSNDRLAKNLGVAIVNPNASNVNVTLTLRNNDGTQMATTTVNVPSHQQTANFIRELFSGQSSVPSEMTGTLAVTSTGSPSLPVSVIGLRFRGFNFSTLPVTSLSGDAGPLPTIAIDVGGAGAVLLPQFAAGGGWATELVLLNTGTSSLTVRVDLFRPDGTPLTAALNHQTGSSFTNLTIPAGGILTLAPRDRNGDDDF